MDIASSGSPHEAQHERTPESMTSSDVETWLAGCVKDPAPSPPSPIPPSSPEWETPKYHQKRQKQRNQRAEKVAQEARASPRSKTTIKLPNQTPNLGGDWTPKEGLCQDCPILAPHRTGLYAYGSPELPKKILIIQAKIVKATATENDIRLQNGFAAVHAKFARGQLQPVTEFANAGDNASGMQTSDLKNQQERSQCQHPQCPVQAWHRSGSRSRPKKIKNARAKIVKGIATEDDFQLLKEFLAVHDPEEDNEGGGVSSERVEIQ